MLEEVAYTITIKDLRWFKRYLRFINYFKMDVDIKGKTHKHHILPKSLYPDYVDFKIYLWNKATLSHRAHFIAHYMLGKAFGGNQFAPLFFILSKSEKYRYNSRYILEAKQNHAKCVSLARSGMVTAKHIISSEVVYVTKDEFDSNELLVGVNHNNKEVASKISESLNRIESNGKTVAQNRAMIGDKNPRYGKEGTFKGKTHSEETKQKISEKAKGRKMSTLTKQKISNSCSKPKNSKENYIKYIYKLTKDNIVIFSCYDSREMSQYLSDNKLPSLYKLNKYGVVLGYKFSKEAKS